MTGHFSTWLTRAAGERGVDGFDADEMMGFFFGDGAAFVYRIGG